MNWNVATRNSKIPECELPAVRQMAVDLFDLMQKNLPYKTGEKAKWNFEKAHSIYTRSVSLCCGGTLTTHRVNPQRYVPVHTSTYQYHDVPVRTSMYWYWMMIGPYSMPILITSSLWPTSKMSLCVSCAFMLGQVTCNTMRPCWRSSKRMSPKMLDRKQSLKTSMTWNVLPCLIEIIICQVRQASGIHRCSSWATDI